MLQKKTREAIAYDYLKDCGPCLITYKENDSAKILLGSGGELFWINDVAGPDVPYITLDDVLAEAKHVLLALFAAQMTETLTSKELYEIENELRCSLVVLLDNKSLSKEDVREIKIKFMDVKEEILMRSAVNEVQDGEKKDADSAVKILSKNKGGGVVDGIVNGLDEDKVSGHSITQDKVVADGKNDGNKVSRVGKQHVGIAGVIMKDGKDLVKGGYKKIPEGLFAEDEIPF